MKNHSKQTYSGQLAWILPQLSYLCMLFIFQLTCAVSDAGQLKNKWHAQMSTLWWKWFLYNANPGLFVVTLDVEKKTYVL